MQALLGCPPASHTPLIHEMQDNLLVSIPLNSLSTWTDTKFFNLCLPFLDQLVKAILSLSFCELKAGRTNNPEGCGWPSRYPRNNSLFGSLDAASKTSIIRLMNYMVAVFNPCLSLLICSTKKLASLLKPRPLSL